MNGTTNSHKNTGLRWTFRGGERSLHITCERRRALFRARHAIWASKREGAAKVTGITGQKGRRPTVMRGENRRNKARTGLREKQKNALKDSQWTRGKCHGQERNKDEPTRGAGGKPPNVVLEGKTGRK